MKIAIFLLHLLLRLAFRFRAFGLASTQVQGPVLLLPNHASWLDWLFLCAVLDEDWKFVTSSVTAQTSFLHRWLMLNRRTFPIDLSSPYALRDMTEFLARGGRLVLFPEGRISTSGELMKIFPGAGFLARRTHPKIITCYLRNVKRLKLTKQPGWTRWFPRIEAHFTKAFTAPDIAAESQSVARERTTVWLRDQMVRQQFEVELAHGPKNLLQAIANNAASIPHRTALEDVTFKTLTYRQLLVMARALANELARRLDRKNPRVGVLLPSINTTPAVLLALWMKDHVPAMLNYSSGPATMLVCAQLAQIRQIITSRKFIEKAKLNLSLLTESGIELVFLEDVREAITLPAKLAAVLQTSVPCASERLGRDIAPFTTAVVLFTSGSEGQPKGVELSHRNLMANILQSVAVADFSDNDRFFNALPLFHCFGLVEGTFLPLVRGCYTFLYPSPLHYRAIPALFYDRDATVLLATNTFLNGYARKAHPYDFRSLRLLLAGAEKVQTATFELWARKFGVRILEGYGATECSPLVSVNTPMNASFGTVGRLLPGIECRLEPIEGVTEGGRLFVRGPNVMKGYLNPTAQAQFQALLGWYDTGDIASLDADGFLTIRGRMKRFAKVSGEMVSLTAVEDALAGAYPLYGMNCQIAVVAIPDEDKGEKLIAVTTEPRLTLSDLRGTLKAKGLSNLCAPREIVVVKQIPKLGTGKVDHRAAASLVRA
jgi:acyl-[acyl-carrier-protein]-phospholipid O-acyltransferase/long-chain-fatty-acid--[acyl-carrier-protein] ligase